MSEIYPRNSVDQRAGQALYNAAREFFPTECGAINGTWADPFNNDEAIPMFLRMLAVEIEETENRGK